MLSQAIQAVQVTDLYLRCSADFPQVEPRSLTPSLLAEWAVLGFWGHFEIMGETFVYHSSEAGGIRFYGAGLFLALGGIVRSRLFNTFRCRRFGFSARVVSTFSVLRRKELLFQAHFSAFCLAVASSA